jgi:hypothetical protein
MMRAQLTTCVVSMLVLFGTAVHGQETVNVFERIDSMLMANNIDVNVAVVFVPHRQNSCITCDIRTIALVDSVVNCFPESQRKDVVVLYVVGVARKIEWSQAIKTIGALAGR